MKWMILFSLTLLLADGVIAYTPEQYAQQVVQKDLPFSLRWFGKIASSDRLSQVEVYELYQSALPETQVNKQLGISVKAAIGRMLVLLDGARYFEEIQKAPVDFQSKKEGVNKVLQLANDEVNRFQYGEDPQALIEEWRAQSSQLYGADFTKFASDLVEVFTAVEKFLTSSEVEGLAEEEAGVERESFGENEENEENEEFFETQRFQSYIESAEEGKIAEECQSALAWKTDQAEFCQNDDFLECDRSYARQCKKLQ
ncbi:MAG: hypothetical protein ACXWRE_16470 [Pseudobdellovibrionaceae bacterium]